MNDTYSEIRDRKSDVYNSRINECLTDFYSEPIKIKDNHGNIEDFKGVDKIINGDKWQVKTIKWEGYDTVTIPVVDYEKYKNIPDLKIIHAYFEPGSSKLKQYVIFKFEDILQFENIRKKRKRGNGINSNARDTDNGTVFYYWSYNSIDNIILKKYIPSEIYAFIDTDEE